MVYSAERRDKLERWFNFDLIPGLAKEKNVVYLGTILHYHALLKKVVDRSGKYESWNTKLYKAIENGKSAWEAKYTMDELIAMRDDPSSPNYVGSIVFAQEYQNEPQDDQDRIIKLEWIKSYSYSAKLNSIEGVNDVVRKDIFLKSLEIYAGVDPAIGQKETSDNFSMYVMGFDKLTGEELQLDLIHGKFTIDEQVERIVNCCIEWKVETLGIETVAYQAGLYQLVKKQVQIKGINLRIVAIKTDKDKIRRARIHSVAFEGGFVKLRSDHPKSDIIRREIEEFPFGEHDDTFDSLMLARELRVKPKSRGFVKKPTGF
jgi:predicted phage terminase large subunit-like protein